MSLLQRAREDKPSAMAFYLVACDCLEAVGIAVPAVNIAATCAAYGVARGQAYDVKARIEAVLAAAPVASPGRPRQGAVAETHEGATRIEAARDLESLVLRHRLANPGAAVEHGSGRWNYSDGFKRFILDAADRFEGRDEAFCRASGVPLSTLTTWRLLDAKEPIVRSPRREEARWPTGANPNELARTITDAYERWDGKVGDFLRDAARRFSVAPTAIRSVMRIAGMLAVTDTKPPRYRGSTLNASPGTIVVTDGKKVEIELAASAELRNVNWQGIVDQATACHLAVVVTPTEDAAAVGAAYTGACAFLGKAPLALVHDQKPIHDDSELHKLVEAATAMIPATLGRGQNKAVMEGEFGRWAREVGRILLDDTSTETLIMSAAREVIRAYTSGINHAARKELDGRSRAAAVREICPDPKKDAELVQKLKASHQRGPHKATPLPTATIARLLLDDGFERESLIAVDVCGRLRAWLAATFEPDAIRQALAIFGAKRAKGALRGKHAHRYLVKLISGAQTEIDLEKEERILLHYAETERRSWLAALTQAKEALSSEHATDERHIIAMAEHALCGSIFLEKAFWEKELSAALAATPALVSTVTTYIRRQYEAPALCRRRLLNRLVTINAELARPLD